MEKFNLSMKKWNITSEKGLPEDGAWCFLLFKSRDSFSWTIGSYFEDKGHFWANMGFGGMVLEAEDVYAWADWDDIELECN